jgi:predicted nucleic acid-binding protein
MLSICQPMAHPFSEWHLPDLLRDFADRSLDWNDQLITENCRKNGLALLIHDGDFTEGGISVFTANNRLLASS